MANEKKAGEVTLLNKGVRKFDHGARDGKPRLQGPNTTMTFSAEEAEKLAGYKELVDISKLPGQVDARKLKQDNLALSDENARLREQLAALNDRKADEPKRERSEKSEKGK